MPQHIVERAEALLHQLEHSGSSIQTVLAELSTTAIHSNGNGSFSYVAEPAGRYEWQSEEARSVAAALDHLDQLPADLGMIDLSSITPLDALNLLFLMQKKRKAHSR
jgi:DNA mismatch repair protein MutS